MTYYPSAPSAQRSHSAVSIHTMSAYFGAIGSNLLTLQAIVNEVGRCSLIHSSPSFSLFMNEQSPTPPQIQDILHAISHATCTGWVTLLDELSFQIILLAIKSFDDLSTGEVVRVMVEYNECVSPPPFRNLSFYN